MKERIIETVKYFFISTVLINAAMFVTGSLFAPDQTFGYEIMIYPLIYGFLACIPSFIMYTNRELSVRQALIRNIIQLIFIVAIIEAMVFRGQISDFGRPAAAVAVSVVLIYLGVMLIRYKMDQKTAQEMTDQLKDFQNKVIREQ
jgi:hypothetical protein